MERSRHAMRSNTRLLTVITGLALTACVIACAETTNRFETIQSTTAGSAMYEGLHLSKLDAHALGPVKEDPEGNWGAVTGGLLLSIRFQQPVFQAGEPVRALVLLRNATNSVVGYRERFVGGRRREDGQVSIVEFLVTNETTHTLLEARWIDTVFQHFETSPLQPMQQALYVNRLDQILELQPGRYSVQATQPLKDALGRSPGPLTSGVAHITIAEAPADPKGPGTLGGGSNSPTR